MVNTQLPAVFVPVKPLPADTVPADTVPVTVRLLSEPTEVNEELTTVGFRVFPVSVPAAAEEIGQLVPFALHYILSRNGHRCIRRNVRCIETAIVRSSHGGTNAKLVCARVIKVSVEGSSDSIAAPKPQSPAKLDLVLCSQSLSIAKQGWKSRGNGKTAIIHKVHADAVNRLVTVPLTQNPFDALVDFTFNLGEGALARSTLLRLLNAGKHDYAAEQFLALDHVNGLMVPGLLRRRRAEMELFNKGAGK